MALIEETRQLRRQLAAWAADPEWALLARYDLLRNTPPRSLVARVGRWLRWRLADLGLARPPVTPYAWLPTLKHAPGAAEIKTLLIWAPGASRDELRSACDGFVTRLKNAPGLVPVLVTDVADFAIFSRLQWLVEYVPELPGEDQAYGERKLRYLAWRYREAVVVPVAAGLAGIEEWRQLVEMGT